MGRPTDLLQMPDFHMRGNCYGQDAELWWAEDDAAKRIAVAVCQACPVRVECLEHALAVPEKEGIWGGLLPYERKRLIVHRRQKAVA